MSSTFQVFPATDFIIEFLKDNPDSIHEDFLEGEPPFLSGDDPDLEERLSSEWPQSEPDEIGPEEVSSRNVDLYHFVLNGTSDNVEGSGTLFQTWLGSMDQHAAINLTGEDFAFKSAQLPELRDLLSKLSEAVVSSRCIEWEKGISPNYAHSAEDHRFIFEQFERFRREIEQLIALGHGIIWIRS